MRFKEISFEHTKESWIAFKDGNYDVLGILTLITKEGFPKKYKCDYKTFRVKLESFNKLKNIT